MRYGIKNLSTPILGGPPDLALSGFNVGGGYIQSFYTTSKPLRKSYSKHWSRNFPLRHRRSGL